MTCQHITTRLSGSGYNRVRICNDCGHEQHEPASFPDTMSNSMRRRIMHQLNTGGEGPRCRQCGNGTFGADVCGECQRRSRAKAAPPFDREATIALVQAARAVFVAWADRGILDMVAVLDRLSEALVPFDDLVES